MIKIVMSKEGIKRVLAKHDVHEMENIYIVTIEPHWEIVGFYSFRSVILLDCSVGYLEKCFERDDVMFIKIDTSDEKNLTTMEADNEL